MHEVTENYKAIPIRYCGPAPFEMLTPEQELARAIERMNAVNTELLRILKRIFPDA